MSENKKTFEVELDGKTVEMAVIKPTHKTSNKANLVYNRAFREAVNPEDGGKGALVREKIDDVMKEQNLWNDAKRQEYEKLVRALLEGERKLTKGGIKLSEGRKVAIQMKRDRYALKILGSERDSLDQVTAQAQAEQARFDYLVSACTVYENTGKPYFESVEDYLSRENDPVVVPAAQALGKLIYGLADDFEHKLPENKFLLKYKFCDEKLRLVRKDGKFVNLDDKLIDEKGRLINEAGDLIDMDGNPITEEGQYKVDFVEFEDDSDSVGKEAVAAA